MATSRYNIRLAFLAALLLLQIAGAVHVYSHDMGIVTGGACATCSVANNLHALGPALPDGYVARLPQDRQDIVADDDYSVTTTPSAQPRGPPPKS